MPDELGGLLANIEIPAADAARKSTTTAALAGYADPAPAKSGPRLTRRLITAAGALLLLVAFYFTPPGGAIAEEVGELVGIGDEPSDSFGHTFSEDGDDGDVEEEVVGLGTTPGGVPFELAENTTRAKDGPGFIEQSCVYISFPNTEIASPGASCMTDAALRDIEDGTVLRVFAFIGPKELGEGSDLIVSLTGRPEIERVEVSYPADGAHETVEATLAPFSAAPAQSQDRLEVDSPRGETPLVMGAAFLPTTPYRQLGPPQEPESRIDAFRAEHFNVQLDPSGVRKLLQDTRVVAYDAEGDVVAESNLDRPWIDYMFAEELKPAD